MAITDEESRFGIRLTPKRVNELKSLYVLSDPSQKHTRHMQFGARVILGQRKNSNDMEANRFKVNQISPYRNTKHTRHTQFGAKVSLGQRKNSNDLEVNRSKGSKVSPYPPDILCPSAGTILLLLNIWFTLRSTERYLTTSNILCVHVTPGYYPLYVKISPIYGTPGLKPQSRT
ncbi:hypothetical protein J6590_003037 [Homalodisca vitripennis]|nr:hypothetical protein J6590_003037 [Homalodisca vitripennis]